MSSINSIIVSLTSASALTLTLASNAITTMVPITVTIMSTITMALAGANSIASPFQFLYVEACICHNRMQPRHGLQTPLGPPPRTLDATAADGRRTFQEGSY